MKQARYLRSETYTGNTVVFVTIHDDQGIRKSYATTVLPPEDVDEVARDYAEKEGVPPSEVHFDGVIRHESWFLGPREECHAE